MGTPVETTSNSKWPALLDAALLTSAAYGTAKTPAMQWLSSPISSNGVAALSMLNAISLKIFDVQNDVFGSILALTFSTTVASLGAMALAKRTSIVISPYAVAQVGLFNLATKVFIISGTHLAQAAYDYFYPSQEKPKDDEPKVTSKSDKPYEAPKADKPISPTGDADPSLDKTGDHDDAKDIPVRPDWGKRVDAINQDGILRPKSARQKSMRLSKKPGSTQPVPPRNPSMLQRSASFLADSANSFAALLSVPTEADDSNLTVTIPGELTQGKKLYITYGKQRKIGPFAPQDPQKIKAVLEAMEEHGNKDAKLQRILNIAKEEVDIAKETLDSKNVSEPIVEISIFINPRETQKSHVLIRFDQGKKFRDETTEFILQDELEEL